MTTCSRPGSRSATSPTRPRWPRATPEATAYATSAGEVGRNRPCSMRRSTPSVSTSAAATLDGGVERSVHGDQVVLAHDEVDLEQVHVAGAAEQRRVHGDEPVVGIAVHGRHVVALPARLDHLGVAAQAVQEPVDLLVPHRHVHPQETVVAAEQHDHVVARPVVRPVAVDEPDLHVHSVALGGGAVQSPPRRRE